MPHTLKMYYLNVGWWNDGTTVSAQFQNGLGTSSLLMGKCATTGWFSTWMTSTLFTVSLNPQNGTGGLDSLKCTLASPYSLRFDGSTLAVASNKSCGGTIYYHFSEKLPSLYLLFFLAHKVKSAS